MERNNESKQPIQKNYKVLCNMSEESMKKVQCEVSKSASGKSVPIKGMPEETKEPPLFDEEPAMDSITMGNKMRANYNKNILSGGDNCLYPESENYQMPYHSYPKKRHIPNSLQQIAFFFIGRFY